MVFIFHNLIAEIKNMDICIYKLQKEVCVNFNSKNDDQA